MIFSLNFQLKADMPPGWKKAVKSGTLLESFVFVDTYPFTWKSEEKFEYLRKCNVRDKTEKKKHMYSEVIVNLLDKLDSGNITEEQLETIVDKLRIFDE